MPAGKVLADLADLWLAINYCVVITGKTERWGINSVDHQLPLTVFPNRQGLYR